MLVSLLILLVIAVVAYYIITKFFPGDIQWVALLIAGIVLLAWLLNMTGLIGKL